MYIMIACINQKGQLLLVLLSQSDYNHVVFAKASTAINQSVILL